MRTRSILRLAAAPLLLAGALAGCSERSPSLAAPAGPRLTVTPTTAFTFIESGGTHSCGLASGGQAWCWGRNAQGQLGDSTAAATQVPVAVYQPGLSFTTITAGASHTCALTSSGQAYCWGTNGDGRLGDSTFVLPLAPSAVLPLGGIAFTSIHAGGAHTCGLNASGQAYCWGNNTYAQIGDSTKTFAYGPTAVHQPVGVTFTQIVAADKHTCALDTGGQAYCWGYGGDGAVGNNSLLGSRIPVAVQQPVGVTFASIEAQYNHSCGLTSGGQAYCWGYNFYGQLGDGSTTNRKVPVAVVQPVGVTYASVTTGSSHTCGVDGSGQEYCWGNNQYGQLGDGTNTSSVSAVAVSQPVGVAFSQIRSGQSFSCGLDGVGQTYCWGINLYSQIGDNSTTNRNAPTATVH